GELALLGQVQDEVTAVSADASVAHVPGQSQGGFVTLQRGGLNGGRGRRRRRAGLFRRLAAALRRAQGRVRLLPDRAGYDNESGRPANAKQDEGAEAAQQKAHIGFLPGTRFVTCPRRGLLFRAFRLREDFQDGDLIFLGRGHAVRGRGDTRGEGGFLRGF